MFEFFKTSCLLSAILAPALVNKSLLKPMCSPYPFVICTSKPRLVYFLIIPISSVHYLKIRKKYNFQDENNEHEDIL